MLYKETVPVYTDNHNNPQTQNVDLQILKAGDTYMVTSWF
jgi:hypothetical protein